MIMEKKDVFYDVVLNPKLTLYDFASVGHSAQNSELLSAEDYKKNKKVVDFFTKDGVFDNDAFNAHYDAAKKVYAELTDVDVNKHIMEQQSYNPNNIWAAPQTRTRNLVPQIMFSPNPDRTTESMYQIGFKGPRTQSIDEIAQSQQVLLNPKEALRKDGSIDESKAKWGNAPATLFDSPGEWFKDLFKPKVLATWDEDGIHIDPITHEEVEHKKGDRKLNSNGTYYYEELDGREVYGKQVLSPLNTITTDGTRLNQFDFFDSDDINQKSAVGTLMKNAVLVGSMFIPYVGWGVAGASIIGQSIGLAGLLGKLVTGQSGENANSSTLNWMEAFAQQHNRAYTKTEEAQQRPWCLENMIGMVGDVAGQLREQRALFKFAPAVFKGKWGIDQSAAGQQAFLAAEQRNLSNQLLTQDKGATMQKLVRAMSNSNSSGRAKELLKTDINAALSDFAQSSVNKYLKNYNELGEQIGRMYMTAITVQDMYGEAIEAGASPAEAALLTIGYAGMENKLLKSDVGRWIYPELRADKVRFNAITKALTPAIKNESKNIANATAAEQRTWINKLINAGKKIADLDYSTGKTGIGMAITNGLAEGFEEVTEEALADFSKSCYNVYKMVTGDLTGNADTRMDDLFTNFSLKDDFNRYALNFIGGLGGGAINSSTLNFKQLKTYKKMTEKEALGELIHMDLNGELDDYMKWLDKQGTGGNRFLSTSQSGGTFNPGTEEDNQERANRMAIKNQLQMIHNTLEAEKANLSDDSVLKIVMDAFPQLTAEFSPLKRFRYNAFANSYSAGRYLKEWNNICKDLVVATNELYDLEHSKTDAEQSHAEENDTEYKQKVKLAKAKLSKAQAQRDALLKGENIEQFMQDVLFETNLAISANFLPSNEIQYAEWLTNKQYSTLSDKQKKDLKEDYEKWSKSTRADQIHDLATMYWNMMGQISKGLEDSQQYFEALKETQTNSLSLATQFAQQRLQIMNQIVSGQLSTDPQGNPIDPTTALQTEMDAVNAKFNISPYTSATGVNTLPAQLSYITNGQQLLGQLASIDQQVITGTITAKDAIEQKVSTTLNSVVDMYMGALEEIIKTGFIHPEVKNTLLRDITSLMKGLETLDIETATLISADLSDQIEASKLKLTSGAESLKTKISRLPYTPIVNMLSKFTVGAGKGQELVEIIQALITKENENASDLSNLLVSQTDIETWKQAKSLLQVFRAVLAGARYDSMDMDNLSGNTRTLNSITGKTSTGEDSQNPTTTKYAEIDKDTADLAAIDIDMLIDKIDLEIGIHDLNAGNKLVTQQKTSINKNYLFYDKMVKLLDDVDDDDWDKTALDNLRNVVNGMTIHKNNIGTKFDERKFDLSATDQEAMEKEAVLMENAIYDFFQANQEAMKDPAKLAKLFEGMDLFKYNNDILTLNTETVSGGAFAWWLASKAALKSADFYNAYKQIISKAGDANPIAPIPTQELGTYAAVAAITNGTVFQQFSSALQQFMVDKWSALDPNVRRAKAAEINAKFTVDDPSLIKAHNLMPSFANILFIEGIPGSGKSTGVFESILKILELSNPEIYDAAGTATGKHLLDNGIVFAHATQDSAQNAINGMSISDELKAKCTFHDKQSLLAWMSPDYKDTSKNGVYEYIEGIDVITSGGTVESTWKLATYGANVPAVIFIDEWSRYTQPEIDLIQRFCNKHGIQVIAAGDMDQLSPKATLFAEDTPAARTDTSKQKDLSTSKYMTPYVMKLGVSMRTGNGQMSVTLENMQAWRRANLAGISAKSAIELRNYTDSTGIYGAKLFSMSGNSEYTDADLDNIKKTLDVMIKTLKPGEKIGYIYSDPNSKLFKLITSTSTYNDNVEYFTESEAQGREAQYYIVESDRNDYIDLGNGNTQPKTDEDYFRSIYTGVSRASQGALVIARQEGIGNFSMTDLEDSELIPDGFKKDGVIKFAEKRSAILNNLGIAGNDLTVKARATIAPTPRTATVTPAGGTPPPPSGPVPTPGPGGLPGAPGLAPNPAPTGGPTATPPATGGTAAGTSTGGTVVPPPASPAPIPAGPRFAVGQYFYNRQRIRVGQIAQIITEPDRSYTYVLDSGLRVAEGDLPPVNDFTSLQPLFREGATLFDPTTGNSFGTIMGISNSTETGGDIIYQMTTGHDIPESILAGAVETLKPTTLHINDLVVDPQMHNYRVTEINTVEDDTVYTAERIADNQVTTFKESDLMSGLWTKIDSPVAEDPNLDPTEDMFLYNYDGDEFSEILDESIPESPVTIEDGVNDDIIPKLHGETFLSDRTGIDYFSPTSIQDQLNNPENQNRIDNAFGLHRIFEAYKRTHPAATNKFDNYQATKQVLDTIRSAAKYNVDNASILNVVRSLLTDDSGQPLLAATGLQLKWAFVSRVDGNSTNIKQKADGTQDTLYTRYSKDADGPQKTLSLIIENGNNEPILEIPMVVFESPFTMLFKYSKANPGKPLSRCWDGIKSSGRPYPELLKEVLKFMQTERLLDKPGYQDFANICHLWLLTSNGAKFLTRTDKTTGAKDYNWNLASQGQNLGNWHVKARTDEIGGLPQKYPYQGTYTNMETESKRTDVVYSDVLMATHGYMDTDGREQYYVPLYTPFVLRSDNLAYKSARTSEDLMRQFIFESQNPNLAKTVQVVLLTPPEVNFMTYIEAQRTGVWSFNKNETSGKAHNPYGNRFTTVRLLQAIFASAKGNGTGKASAQRLLEGLRRGEPALYAHVEQVINEINNINRTPLDGESKVQTKRRVAQQEKDILNRVDPTYNSTELYTLNGALEKLFYDTCFDESVAGTKQLLDGTHNDENRIALMQDVLKEKIPSRWGTTRPRGTGILAKIKLMPQANNIDFAARVVIKDSNSKYSLPDGNSFRIYGKIDTAKYDLTRALLGAGGLLDTWVQDIITASTVGYKFQDITDSKEFCGLNPHHSTTTPGTNLSPVQPVQESNLDKWKRKYNASLGNIINNIQFTNNDLSEDEFLDLVFQKHIETPGNIAWKSNGQVFLGDVHIDQTLICPQIENLPNMTQKEIRSEVQNGGDFTIIMQDASGQEFNLEIKTSGLPEVNSYQLIYPRFETNQPVQPSDILQAITQAKEKHNGNQMAMSEIQEFEQAYNAYISTPNNSIQKQDCIDLINDTLVFTWLGFDSEDQMIALLEGQPVNEEPQTECPVSVIKKFA